MSVTLVRRNTRTKSKWHLRASDNYYGINSACGPSTVIFDKDSNYVEKQGELDEVTCKRCLRTVVLKNLEEEAK